MILQVDPQIPALPDSVWGFLGLFLVGIFFLIVWPILKRFFKLIDDLQSRDVKMVEQQTTMVRQQTEFNTTLRDHLQSDQVILVKIMGILERIVAKLGV